MGGQALLFEGLVAKPPLAHPQFQLLRGTSWPDLALPVVGAEGAEGSPPESGQLARQVLAPPTLLVALPAPPSGCSEYWAQCLVCLWRSPLGWVLVVGLSHFLHHLLESLGEVPRNLDLHHFPSLLDSLQCPLLLLELLMCNI